MRIIKWGNAIIFLPGMSEIKEVQKLLQEADKDLNVPICHSGADESDQMIPEDQTVFVILATTIAARTLTIPSLKYCIIHPAVRHSVMHPSGIQMLPHMPVSQEILRNMEGRVARTSPGLTTYLFFLDDSERAL